jgi:hypothetical protein
MKKLIYITIFLILSNISYAKIDDYIKISQNGKVNFDSRTINKTLTDASKSVQGDLIKKLDNEMQKITNMLESEVNKINDEINNGIIEKTEKLVDRAEIEFNNVIAMKDKIIIYLIIFSCSLVTMLTLILFLVWRNYVKLGSLHRGNL